MRRTGCPVLDPERLYTVSAELDAVREGTKLWRGDTITSHLANRRRYQRAD